MFKNYSKMQLRLFLAGVAILVVGLISAQMAYLGAKDEIGTGKIQQIVNGKSYVVAPEEVSKAYVRDVGQTTGELGLLIIQVSRWFSDLWRGKQLANTLAFLSIAIACLFFWLSGLYADNTTASSQDDDHQQETID